MVCTGGSARARCVSWWRCSSRSCTASSTDCTAASVSRPAENSDSVMCSCAFQLSMMMSLVGDGQAIATRSEEHTSELQSIMRISYAVFCLKKKKNRNKDVLKRAEVVNYNKCREQKNYT